MKIIVFETKILAKLIPEPSIEELQNYLSVGLDIESNEVEIERIEVKEV
uniref:Uncharacterized protein n=1 Tax=viral metagenome TaxID=1070528 RepID=A0A6M3JNQ2_9ZZZZ